MRTPFFNWLTLGLAFCSVVPQMARASKTDSIHSDKKIQPCSSSKEFITALEFLRSHKKFELSEDQSRKIAEAVAQACTQKSADHSNVAKRFILVTDLLVRSELTSKNAIEIATEFAARTDLQTEAFITVFRYAFLSNYLDLDIRAAIEMAKKLSSEFQGDTRYAVSDFEKIVKYCASEKFLDLPKPRCGEMAGRLAKLGEKEEKSIASAWIDMFEFLRSTRKGPALATVNALDLSEEILSSYGTAGLENFTHAFKYASNKGGLEMSNEDSLKFARKMAAITLPQRGDSTP